MAKASSENAINKKVIMKFKLYKDRKGEWRWRLVSSNEKVIADSGEGYVNKQGCLQGIALVKQSYNATVEEE